MDKDVAIKVENVSKIYKLRRKDKQAGKEDKVQYFYALKDISFEIKKGTTVGLLGTNGSGKSTMALILSEISSPDEGKITVDGEQALIAINSGLDNQLTGIDNIKLKGAMLGLKKSEIDNLIEGVAEFSEIGDFLYQPVKTYSSGMRSRLGFSINLCLNPDILIIDEALSVGDKGFSKKCLEHMKQLRDSGKTVIFISHVIKQVRTLCEYAIWLDAGSLRMQGKSAEVCDAYEEYIDEYNTLTRRLRRRMTRRNFRARILEDKPGLFRRRRNK